MAGMVSVRWVVDGGEKMGWTHYTGGLFISFALRFSYLDYCTPRDMTYMHLGSCFRT
jgi:hypothetical protein